MKRLCIAAALAAAALAASLAQGAGADPATQKAREETAVVFDLGRVFGYLNAIEKDAKVAALSRDQLTRLYDIMVEIRSTKRLEPSRAKALLATIEDRILTSAQLIAVDKLAAGKESEKSANQAAGAGAGSSGGAGSLASYVAGGDFNPVLDATKTMGQDFNAFFEYVRKKIGK